MVAGWMQEREVGSVVVDVQVWRLARGSLERAEACGGANLYAAGVPATAPGVLGTSMVQYDSDVYQFWP
jgi:hypothetical protein